MTEKEQLTMYVNLLAKLVAHYDDRFERITVFGYSDELANWMHENDHYDPNAAFADLAGLLSGFANEIAAVDSRVRS
jgi:hypothetical protein